MQKRHVGQIDLNTGEILEGYIALLQPRRLNGFLEWVAMAQGPLIELAVAGLGEQAYRVMLILLGSLDLDNWIRIDQTEIAQKLNMKQPAVSRAIKMLVEHGVLLVGPPIGRSKTYRLNPSYGWKGKAKRHREVLEERIKAHRLNIVQGGKTDDQETADKPEKLR
jgi:DNA-binding transcriptional ArsR family regulator